MAHIIILNGTSSAGKTTVAQALRQKLPKTFCYYASDQLADAGFRQLSTSTEERDKFFKGFHASIAAFAGADNNLIVEHIIEQQSWADDLSTLLASYDTFWVGIHAPLDELERREKARGDRQIGEAKYHLKTHLYCAYDLEIELINDAELAAQTIANAWHSRISH